MIDIKAPEESPDFLPTPGRGEGVRRLNKRPLVIVFSVIVLAVLTITYTMFERGQSANAATVDPALDAGNVTAPAVAPVKPEDARATAPQMPTDAEPVDMFAQNSAVPTEQVVPAIQSGQGNGAAVQPMPIAEPVPTVSPEVEARRQRAQRIREAKAAAYDAGLGAESGVEGFSRSNANAQRSSGGDPDADMTAALAGMGMGGDMSGPGGMGGGRSPRGGQEGETVDPNQQDHKRAFLADSPSADVYLKHTRQGALAATEVKAGTIIPGVMIGGINSDLPGQIVGQVRQNVYDTATGRFLLIPAGARLVGTYDSTVTNGQNRVLVAWSRIVYPDGSSVSLDLMPGADRGGYAGFKDKTNRHYGRMFMNALLLSGFSAGIQLSQPQSNGGQFSAREVTSAELGRQLGQLGAEMARRGMDVQPTIKVRPGYRFNIMVTKDIILPRWSGRQ